MIDTAYTLLSMAVMLVWLAMRPQHINCPTRWWVPEGIRRSGDFVCRPPLTGDDARDARGILRDHSKQPPGFIAMRVYCPPNSIPTLIGPGTGLCAPR